MTNVMRKSSLLLSSFVLAFAAACTGGSGRGGNRADGGVAADASGGGGGDSQCAAVSGFGDLGAIDGVVFGTGAEYLSIDSTLDATPPVDLFIVELFAGVAPFEEGIAPGTYEITGAQTDYNSCGACVGVFANLPENEAPEMVYTAQSGTLVITSVSGNFAGSFTPAGQSASFVGFSGNADSGFVREDACTVSGGGATWDKAIPGPDPRN